MKVVTCHGGKLQIDEPAEHPPADADRSAASLLTLKPGCVHELIAATGVPRHVAVWLACSSGGPGAVIWCETGTGPYPPAMAAAGLSLDRLYWVRPKNHADMVWAVGESLRCRGVSVTIAIPDKLSRVETRRLQLAAEHGGGIGILVRRPHETIHAASTRWLVRPAPGEPLIQRWRLSLLHGHGRPNDQDVLLEVDRETHHVRTTFVVADRSRQAASR